MLEIKDVFLCSDCRTLRYRLNSHRKLIPLVLGGKVQAEQSLETDSFGVRREGTG